MLIDEKQFKHFVLDAGLVSRAELESAEKEAKKHGAKIGDELVSKGELSDDQKFITQTCIVSHVLGHSEDSSFRGPIDSGSMNAIQKVGSGRSYAIESTAPAV